MSSLPVVTDVVYNVPLHLDTGQGLVAGRGLPGVARYNRTSSSESEVVVLRFDGDGRRATTGLVVEVEARWGVHQQWEVAKKVFLLGFS
jgi:hypothetical protein